MDSTIRLRVVRNSGWCDRRVVSLGLSVTTQEFWREILHRDKDFGE